MESIREKTKESGFTLMEAMVVATLLGLLAVFAGLSMAWFPGAQQKERAHQAAYFLLAALEETRTLERFYGRDVFLSWETGGSGAIVNVSLFRDDDLGGSLDKQKDALIDSWDFLRMFKDARVVADMGVSTQTYLSLQTGPRPTFASGTGVFWVLTERDFGRMDSGADPGQAASYGVVVSNTNNMGARICQPGLDCP